MYDLMDEWPNRQMCHHQRDLYWKVSRFDPKTSRSSWPAGRESDSSTVDACCRCMNHTKTARRRRLRSKHGYYLAVMPNGQVMGIRDAANPYIELEVIPVGADLVKIWGVESELYLMIDDTGLLRATDVDSAECVFQETLTEDFFNVYYSAMYCRKRWTVSLYSNMLRRHRTDSAFLIEVIQRSKSISSVDSEEWHDSH